MFDLGFEAMGLWYLLGSMFIHFNSAESVFIFIVKKFIDSVFYHFLISLPSLCIGTSYTDPRYFSLLHLLDFFLSLAPSPDVSASSLSQTF